MQGLIVAVLLVAAVLQVDARAIVTNNEVLRETMEQSFACATKMGHRASNIPRVNGLDQLPEDNENLNDLWGCIFEKKGLVVSNRINAEKLREYLMAMFTIFVDANDTLREMADDITESCKNVESSTSELTSIKLQNCINYHVREKTGV